MKNLALIAALLILPVVALRAAELKPATLFSDHMVLQRDKAVPVWGWADAGEKVTVIFAGQTNYATADATGKWIVKLAPLAASAEPRELQISGEHHTDAVFVRDVLVGEVWLGSGQSNMARGVSDAKDFPQEKAAANWPLIRMFKENSKPAKTPQADAQGQWTICSSNTVGGFSATLYFFGRDLHRELQVPVGLINSSVGGTPIESWLPEEAQASVPELKPAMEKYRQENEWLGSPAAEAEYQNKPGPKNPWWTPQKQLEARGDLGNLFNGKIAPLIPYALRGVVWYQGEQNAAPGAGQFYQYELPLLVTDWRARWGEELPFAWVQLPNYETSGDWEEGWMLVREAMLKTLRLPHAGMAITVDIGEAKDIHPKNKQDVGQRLALWALGEVYGAKVPATSGPLPTGHEVRGAEMILSFTHADGLQAKDGKSRGFLIAGEDRQWKPAEARIENDKVIASSPEVTKPVAVRYDWAANPDGNLYNSAGLPASPFRTDDWPLSVANTEATPAPQALEKTLIVDGSHLIVPVANGKDGIPFAKGSSNFLVLGIYDGDKLVQSFSVALPEAGEASWLAAYPLEHFGLSGKQITLSPLEGKQAPESLRGAFERIKIGSASDAVSPSDYTQPYRNQFHASTRRGWNNDPNGMVFHDGKYHLYYQHNPFGIFWGNMHWGHLESADLIHWEEKPIALYQKTVKDMAYSGGGFVDFNNSSGLGTNTQFVAFTSTGRGGECLVYSKDGGLTFHELPENPVVKHHGRDPKILWFTPEKKWVMAVFDGDACPETEAIPQTAGPKERANSHIAFYESHNLRQWTHTGNFTDGDRAAVFECPEMFKLPVVGKPGESRWVLLAAQNRYFIGQFDGKTFHKEAGPLGSTHGAFYAAQTFSDVPDGRRIQIGWVRTDAYLAQFPDQIVNQAFTLPHELTIHETADGLRIFSWPVKETKKFRSEVLAKGKNLKPAQANELLQKCQGELSEVLIEFADAAPKQLVINGMDASFSGRAARIFTDRTFNEVYADDGSSYEIRKRLPQNFDSVETHLTADESVQIQSLKIFRLKSIWPK